MARKRGGRGGGRTTRVTKLTSEIVSKQQKEDDKVFLRRAQELRQEGNQHFSNGRLEHARQAYDKALQLCKSHPQEAAAIHSNLGAILLLQHNFEDAVKECTLALEIDPYFIRARQRRARAQEFTGNLIGALQDVRFLLKVLPKGNDALLALNSRLLEQLKNNSAAHKEKDLAKKNSPVKEVEVTLVNVKLQKGKDVRQIEVNSNVNYAELRAYVMEKYHDMSHFAIKYVDKESDTITITSKDDIANAMKVGMNQKGEKAMLKLIIEEVDEKEVPPPPSDEIERTKVLPNFAEELEAQPKVAEEKPEDEIYELDDWMIDFAELFKDQLGIDPDTPLDLSKQAWEKCAEALDASVHHSKSEGLLRQAADKFEDVVTTALLNLGNVHMCIARKYVDATGEEDNTASLDKAHKELQIAENTYKESLTRKSDFVDGVLALGQVQFEKGKMSMSANVPEDHLYHSKNSEGCFKESIKLFEKSLGMVPPEESSDKDKEKEKEGSAESENSHFSNLRAQALVMWGNALYELSQCYASRSESADKWKPLLEEALNKFRDAKCRPEEVQNALRMHSKIEEIDEENIMKHFKE